MSKILHFIVFDFRHIFRDAMLRIFLFFPFIFLAIQYWALPALIVAFPVLADFEAFIIMSLAMQTAILMGFISAFMLLEEKDQAILPVLRVLPISARFFIFYRLGFAVAISTLAAWAIFLLAAYPAATALLLAFQYALVSALIVLILATFANNKIEGLALFKGVNLLLMLPFISFFVPSFWGYFFCFLPMYWPFHWLQILHGGGGVGQWYLVAIVGFAVFALYIGGIFSLFRRRVYEA